MEINKGVSRLANREKQKAKVCSALWVGAVNVLVAPPDNVRAALTAAIRIVEKQQGIRLSYLDLINDQDLGITWGETFTTKAFIEERIRKLKKPTRKELEAAAQIEADEYYRQRLAPSERCPLCDSLMNPNDIFCRECHNQIQVETTLAPS